MNAHHNPSPSLMMAGIIMMMMNPRRSLRLAGSSEDPAGNKDRHKEQGTNKQWGEQEELRNKLLQGSVVSFFVFYLLLQGFFVPHSPLEQGTTYTNKEHKQGTQTGKHKQGTQRTQTRNTNSQHKQGAQTRHNSYRAQLTQTRSTNTTRTRQTVLKQGTRHTNTTRTNRLAQPLQGKTSTKTNKAQLTQEQTCNR